MADLRPFRAARYATTNRAELAKLLAPPYDIISPEEQVALHEAHPHNFVRLELGYTYTDDADRSNRYTRASATLAEWFGSGVLVEDHAPALYLYDQRFTDPTGTVRTRRSVIGVVRLEPFERRVILPHEQTLSAPKEDRFKLMSATGAQFSPIFALYEDPEGALLAALDPAREPVAEATTPDGITHTLGRVAAPGSIRNAVAFIRDRALLIADGHHRYETALRYAASSHARWGVGKDAAPAFALFALTALNDPGLVVLPTHRLVFGLGAALEPNALISRLRAAGFAAEAQRSRATVIEALERASKASVAFAVAFRGDGGTVLVTKQTADLDVCALHRDVIEAVLGIDQEAQRTQRNLSYVKSADSAFAAVDEGRADCAVIMRATPVDAVFRVAMAGERLPQKSTYFVPKLVSGLFFRRVEPLENVVTP